MDRVSSTHNLAYTHPEVASLILWIFEADYITRSTKTPKDVSYGSKRKAMFRCAKSALGHPPYKTMIKNATSGKGRGCSKCKSEARSEARLKGKSLADTHPEVASRVLWIFEADKATRSTRTVKNISYGSRRVAMFKCAKPELGHTPYKTTIKNATDGGGCPKCKSLSMQKPKAGRSLADMNPKVASLVLWIYEMDGVTRSNKTPKDVSIGSDLKAMFKCTKPELGHSPYPAMIKNRAKPKGSGCPTCGGRRFRRVEAGINDLASTHPEVASRVLWIFEADGVTRSITNVKEVSAGSSRVAMFKCAKPELGHTPYKTTINHATGGSGCPKCSTGITEGLFRDSFSHQAKNNFVSVRIPLKRQLFTSGKIQIDMLCKDLNLVIEYDGAWSHGGVKNPNKERTLEDCLDLDTDSTLALIKAGYKVIRIREWSRYEQLPFLEIPGKYDSNIYQVNYKSFGRDKDTIDNLVKQIIEEKKDWFSPACKQLVNSATQNNAILM